MRVVGKFPDSWINVFDTQSIFSAADIDLINQHRTKEVLKIGSPSQHCSKNLFMGFFSMARAITIRPVTRLKMKRTPMWPVSMMLTRDGQLPVCSAPNRIGNTKKHSLIISSEFIFPGSARPFMR